MAFRFSLWWQTGVIYQIYIRSFQDTNGDGIGDLDGITQRLDYLSDVLGVDAIWITPFYPSPMADFGYDVANYVDVHPMFGDLAAFDALLDAAHARNIKVIIDFVPNHTSDQHEWFQQARLSRDNPYRDWYIWADAKPDGSPPNNWLSMFGGKAWQWDEATEQYYLHTFLTEQPDLNWRNPAVKDAMFDVVRFWMDRGVDGLRIDVAHIIMKDPDLRDNPPVEEAFRFARSFGEYDTQQHIHDLAHPDLHGVYRDLRTLLDDYSKTQPRVSIGEIFRPDLMDYVSYYGQDLDELHLPFNFRLIHTPWVAAEVQQVVDALEAALPAAACPNYVLGNHDEPRIASRVGVAQSRIAMMLLLTLRGTPTLYYGDELSMQNGIIPEGEERDPWAKNVPGLGRDPERTPMQWDTSPNAGFSAPDVKPWLPLSADVAERNVECQQHDPQSMLNLTRALLHLRRETPALHLGDYTPADHDNPACYVYFRTDGATRYLIALNFTDAPQTVWLSNPVAGRVILSSYMDREGETLANTLQLRADEGCIMLVDAIEKETV